MIYINRSPVTPFCAEPRGRAMRQVRQKTFKKLLRNKQKEKSEGEKQYSKRKKQTPTRIASISLSKKQTSGKHIGITPYALQIVLYSRIRRLQYRLYQATSAPNTAAIADGSFSLPREIITQGADGRNVSSSDVSIFNCFDVQIIAYIFVFVNENRTF